MTLTSTYVAKEPKSIEMRVLRSVIHRIICTLRLDCDWVEQRFGIDPRDHFADAIEELVPMAEDGLVEIGADGLKVTPRGRFFLRNLCMPFDAYLKQQRPDGPKYSRTV